MSIRLGKCRGCGKEPNSYTTVIDGWWFDWKPGYDDGNSWCYDCVKEMSPVMASTPFVNLYEEEEE